MEDLIEEIINDSQKRRFDFSKGKSDPRKHLREASSVIKDCNAGLYLVLVQGYLKPAFEHLVFDIDAEPHTLCYFGKAGGVRRDGTPIRQTLHGRINNVVAGDVPRALYWQQEMILLGVDKFIVFCRCHSRPLELEQQIYAHLNQNELEYPVMNKKLGRRSR